MWILYDLQVIDMNSNMVSQDSSMVEQVLSYAKRENHRRLKNYQVTLYRSQLIEMNDIGRLHDFYYRQYPEEWRSLYSENPGLFYRLKALFCEADNRVDSADIYFKKAALVLESDPNLILKSRFYHRYGEFYLRHGHKDKALEMFTKSFDLAEKASYFKYMMLASGELETLYASMRDFQRAYDFASRNRILADSLNNLSKKDQILIMEIDHETREQEMMAEKHRHETERRHYLQYMAMVIAILTTFIILIMLGSLRVSEWIIRMLGFFSFIFLFEFIILLADHKIHELTHGEPWKIMLIKIFLIAILLPMHHSIEKRVITYLLSHQLIKKSHFSFLKGIRPGRKKQPSSHAEETETK
jgi:tetratricopeptide (TPR) repeat protein